MSAASSRSNSVEVRARVSGYLDRRAFQGRPNRQAGRSAVHDRQAPVPERARAGARQSGAGASRTSPSPKPISQRAPATGARQDHHRADLRTARAGQAQCRRRRSRRSEAAVRQAELDLAIHRTARAGRPAASATAASRRAIWSPAAPPATRRCSPPSCRSIRSASNSPSTRRRTCATSGCAQERPRRSPAAAARHRSALQLIDENDFVHSGRMDFVDNVIDRSTGTIRGRAVFANPDGLFTPGMFARVRVPGSPPYEALLVPDRAIGSEQARKFVLVVGADEHRRAAIRHARPGARRQPARHQGRPRRRRPRHRQRPDARARRAEGHAAGAGRRRRRAAPATPRRK